MIHLRLLPLLLSVLLLPISCRSQLPPQQALAAAASNGNLDSICNAVERGASPNLRRAGNETPLGLLIQGYKRSTPDRQKEIEEAVTYLLARGAAPNALHHGFTPLQIATGQGSNVIVSRLLTFGADPNMETRAGLAPIWQAVYDNNYTIGLTLLKAGANPNAKNTQGQTPLEYMKSKGYSRTRLMLHLRYYGGH